MSLHQSIVINHTIESLTFGIFCLLNTSAYYLVQCSDSLSNEKMSNLLR